MAAPVFMTSAIKNVDIAFDGVAESSVARGDDDFEEIGADGEMGRNSENIDHRSASGYSRRRRREIR